MKSPMTLRSVEALGRVRLSRSFFMRDFLYSEIGAVHGIRNVPEHPDVAIAMGRRLCEDVLEALQQTFGRVAIRSAYRSPTLNAFGNAHGMNCAANRRNYARHIWDIPDQNGHGAMACVVLPWLVDRVGAGGAWTEMAWWIHDHLPYSGLQFFPKLLAFNIGWHERPTRSISSFVQPRGYLTKPGWANQSGSHADEYVGYPEPSR